MVFYIPLVNLYCEGVDSLKLFYCYSIPLKKELMDNGFKYLHNGIHHKTKKTFWVFEGSEEFNNYFKSREKY